jgi:hypothetical protein
VVVENARSASELLIVVPSHAVDAPNPEICWCTVDGFTVTAPEAGVPGCFVVAPELDPEEELDEPEDELEPDDPASEDEPDDPVPEDELEPDDPVPEDELEPDESVPDELLELVDPAPDDVPDPEVLEFDPDVPELVAYVVPELDPCSLEPEPPFCDPPPQAASAKDVAMGATRRDRIRMG